MQADFEAAMAASVEHINDNYEVADLCRSFPRRVDELIAAKGGRLKHSYRKMQAFCFSKQFSEAVSLCC
jgi:hypothetical protein